MQQYRSAHRSGGESRMNDDVIRLSDLVPEYARYYKVSSKEAAHDLHEVIRELHMEYSEIQKNKLSPNDIFWVGKTGSPQKSTRIYSLSFEGLGKYFDLILNPLPGLDNSLAECFCASDADFKKIPASTIYASKQSLSERMIGVGFERSDFLLDSSSTSQPETGHDEESFKTIELNYISLIINGLIELIKEVDKAHTEKPLKPEARERAKKIKLRASQLHSHRKNSDPSPSIQNLAEAAGVKIPRSVQTIRKYMGRSSSQ